MGVWVGSLSHPHQQQRPLPRGQADSSALPSPCVTSPSLGRSPFGFLTWKKDSSTTCPQAFGKPQPTDSSNWHTVGASKARLPSPVGAGDADALLGSGKAPSPQPVRGPRPSLPPPGKQHLFVGTRLLFLCSMFFPRVNVPAALTPGDKPALPITARGEGLGIPGGRGWRG